MITSKEDYKRYVAQDMKALGAKTRHPLIQTDNSMIWLVDPSGSIPTVASSP